MSIQSFAYSFTNKYLPLPASLADKPVQYLRVKQIPNWSCGYNALYNACCVEQFIGQPNKHTQLEYFNNICQPYTYNHNKKPMGSSSNRTLEALASQLNLQKLTCLAIENDHTIKPLIRNVRFNYEFLHNDSPQIREYKADRALKAKLQGYLNKLAQDFNNAPQSSCMHFICNIDTARGKHWVLVSITKNSKGERLLYVCDNMNSPITEHSQMKRYITYLHKLFNLNNTTPVIQKPTVPVHPMQLELYKQQNMRKRKAKIYKSLAQYQAYKQYKQAGN